MQYVMNSSPPGFVDDSSFVTSGTEVSTLDLHGEISGYMFGYWTINGVRQEDNIGTALDQVTFLAVENSTIALNGGTATLRPATKLGPVTGSAPPETWLVSCPWRTTGEIPHDMERTVFQYGPTWRYNVGHLDGHADVHTWDTSRRVSWRYYSTGGSSGMNDYIDTENDKLGK